MEFSLNEETVLLKNSAERFLREKCPASLVKELIEDENGFSPSIWKEMADLGWLGLIHGEKYGGSEGSFFDLFVLFEEMGRVLLPSPFFSSAVLSGLVVDDAGGETLKASLLPSIIQGKKILSLALLDERGRYDGHDPGVKAEARGDSYFLSGTRLFVPYAHVADGILLCADTRNSGPVGPTLFLVDKNADGQQIIFLHTLSGEKTFAVKYEDARVPAESVIGSPGNGHTYLDRVLPKATVLKCGEMLGGMRSVLDMSLAHVKERHQFGKPLGSLQVVQHYCADMSTYLESSRLIAYQAASLLSQGAPCEKEIAMAKAWCSDAYKKCTWIAHQMHGGIGFTEEHDLHLYYKHAKTSELTFGDSRFHRQKLWSHFNN